MGVGERPVFSGGGGCQRCERCETTFCLLPKQFLIWEAFDYDHGSICISSWERERTRRGSPTRVCSHQEQGRCQQWPSPSPEVAAELKNFFL